jgi:hypothetical protein
MIVTIICVLVMLVASITLYFKNKNDTINIVNTINKINNDDILYNKKQNIIIKNLKDNIELIKKNIPPDTLANYKPIPISIDSIRNTPVTPATIVSPNDCIVNTWGSCSKSCDGGIMYPLSTIPSKNGGRPCPVSQECNTQPCPIDCITSDWGSCTTNCGGGYLSRDVLQESLYGGKQCGQLNKECNTQPCPIDCIMSDWINQGTCSTSCGGGKQKQTRSIVSQELYGGAVCSTVTSEDVPCNTQPCPIDCVMSDWVNQGTCSTSCGGGQQQQVRTVKISSAYGGQTCPTNTTQSVPCNTQPCPIDCVMGPWSNQGSCSANCGGGSQQQVRSVQTQPQYGGKACPATTQSISCNNQACPPVDCQVGGWYNATNCTSSCGYGTLVQYRNVTVQPQNGGAGCPSTSQNASCYQTNGCPPPPPPPPSYPSCSRPGGWCSHAGSSYSQVDCIGNGSYGDHLCTDNMGQRGSILRTNGCSSIWPNAPSGSCSRYGF